MATTVKNSKKVVNTTKLLSNEKLGELLYSKNVSFEEAVKQFTTYYKTKQNITDKTFIKLRTKIYLRIAEKRAQKSDEQKIMLEQ